jgi:hypothetical protein
MGEAARERARTQTSRTAALTRSLTAAWKAGKRSHVIAVSNVSDKTPMAMNASRR